jgi:hypothetical protein
VTAGNQNARTTDDYETLRRYATEGGEAHDGAEAELAAFIAHGAATWICQRRQAQARHERRGQGESRGILAVLLANMMESRGES